MPTELNFRANIWGLKALGAEWVISISAVGSMRQGIKPLDLVIPDQFFDATKRRVSSFFGEGIVAHVGMAEPVCPDLATTLEKAARQTGATVHRGGTYICIEGPQFSTKAESRIYRSWGVDVIGMTNMPEAKLAREAELCYATLALATDYDVWHETHEAVTVEAVVKNLLQNVAAAKEVLRRAIPLVAASRACPCPSLLRDAIITNPNAFPPAARRRLGLLIAKYVASGGGAEPRHLLLVRGELLHARSTGGACRPGFSQRAHQAARRPRHRRQWAAGGAGPDLPLDRAVRL
jgi:5'-methylthioadenosine phosphorylase